ncbi:helix-turn-helix domain-containing protein [bacterium]|nr:helix-turn-helix domain-containing protein [bacterium]
MSKMLNVTEAAEHYKVSTATIRRWIRSGRVRSQLTLGPFGEQWMIDPDGLVVDDRAQGPYLPVEQLMEKPDHGGDQALLKEAQEALQQAWEAKEKAEQELDSLRNQCFDSDVFSLRVDLEGSESARARLAQELEVLRGSERQAWEETRTALRALGSAYQESERLGRLVQQLETESDCLRRNLAQRLGLEWREHSLLQLFLRWDSMGDWATASLERPDWSQLRRRQTLSEELDAG